MISYLKGTIALKTLQYLVVEINGVGYKVFVTPTSLDAEKGTIIELFTYLKSSDEGMSLYGLPSFEALKTFEMLLTVSGVGPKVALGIMSASSNEAVLEAIASKDSSWFSKVSGVGKKTSERIILELQNKVESLGVPSRAGQGDVFEALISLGYSTKEVRETINKLDPQTNPSDQLKAALKLLGR